MTWHDYFVTHYFFFLNIFPHLTCDKKLILVYYYFVCMKFAMFRNAKQETEHTMASLSDLLQA